MTSKNICKFCGQEKKLIKAHIIPRNFYLDYKNEQYMEVDELSGKFTIKQNGSYDKNILCAECDGKILGKFDQEGYRILLDEIYKHCLYHDDKIKIYNLTSEYYDYNKFRRFFISILWKASISSLPEYSHIQLGEYEDKALAILKGIASYENLFKIYIYKYPKNKDYNKFIYITKSKIANYKTFVLNMAGYMIFIILNGKNHIYTKINHPISKMIINNKNFCIIESEELYFQHQHMAEQKMHEMWRKGYIPPFAPKVKTKKDSF